MRTIDPDCWVQVNETIDGNFAVKFGGGTKDSFKNVLEDLKAVIWPQWRRFSLEEKIWYINRTQGHVLLSWVRRNFAGNKQKIVIKPDTAKVIREKAADEKRQDEAFGGKTINWDSLKESVLDELSKNSPFGSATDYTTERDRNLRRTVAREVGKAFRSSTAYVPPGEQTVYTEDDLDSPLKTTVRYGFGDPPKRDSEFESGLNPQTWTVAGGVPPSRVSAPSDGETEVTRKWREEANRRGKEVNQLNQIIARLQLQIEHLEGNQKTFSDKKWEEKFAQLNRDIARYQVEGINLRRQITDLQARLRTGHQAPNIWQHTAPLNQNKDYTVLGLIPTAEPEAVKAAYRALAAKHHPDKNDNKEEATKRMQEINDAYDRIKKARKIL